MGRERVWNWRGRDTPGGKEGGYCGWIRRGRLQSEKFWERGISNVSKTGASLNG